jgi:hypothetical protein
MFGKKDGPASALLETYMQQILGALAALSQKIDEMRGDVRRIEAGKSAGYNPRRVAAGIKAAETRRKKAAVTRMVLDGMDSQPVREQSES